MDRLAPALPAAEAGLLRKLLALTSVALAAGVAGGWVLFERDDEVETVSEWSTCSNPVAGFAIDYPAGWYTDHTAIDFACTYFDPRPFELSRDGDWGPTALQVVVDQGAGEGPFERPTADGLVQYGHVVETSGRRFSVLTTFNEGLDYSEWKRIVDKAAASLVATEPQRSSPLGANVIPPQARLPEPVARKRAAIWEAARRTAYEAVARLVDPKGFEYTFGGPVQGGPGTYWRLIDRTTKERPLPTLAAILELPYAYQPESKLFVWPFAFVRQASSLTIDEKERLADALGDEFLRQYEQLGSYLGYRAGIDAQGNWVFYVAGD